MITGINMKKFYMVLCLVGIVLPYWQFISWIAENEFAITALMAEAVGSRISAFAWLDVIISAVVLIGFILHEGYRQSIKLLWLPILATCLVGVSFGLPMFLLMREIHLARQSNPEEAY